MAAAAIEAASPGLVRDVSIAVGALLGAYTLYPGREQMPAKRRAWIMSCLSALTTSSIAVKHMSEFAASGFSAASLFHDDPLSRFSVTFFTSYLALDILVGYSQYPGELDLLTAWIHHSVYILLCVWAMVGRFTVLSSAMMSIEIPTFILALGKLEPKYRADLAFGATFFTFRIAYFAIYFMALLLDPQPQSAIRFFGPLIMFLHLHWFYGWVKQQLRLAKKGKEGGAAKALDGDQEAKAAKAH